MSIEAPPRTKRSARRTGASRWRPSDDPLRGALRAVRAHVDAAVRAMESRGDGDDLDTSVHDARRSLKRARSLLTLLAPALGRGVARGIVAAARDVGRALSRARDAAIVLSAAERAWTRSSDAAPPALVALLERERAAQRALLQELVPPRVAALRRLRRDLARLRLPAGDTADLRKGLRRLHRRAAAAATAALATPDDATLHEARRRLKALADVVDYLSPAWPSVMDAWSGACRDATDVLGLDHDQVVLRSRAQALRGPLADDVADATIARSWEESTALRAAALPHLNRLAAEPSVAFVDRHLAYVQATAARADRPKGREEP